MAGGLATRYAPSFALIRAHFAFGVAGLVAFGVALAARASDLEGFFFQPLLLGLVHLCVLGWLVPTAIGALHQLVPVVFEVPVRSERVAWAAFALYAVSATTFITRMWVLDHGLWLPLAGTLAAAAIWLYAGNLIATLARSRTRSLTGACVVAALAYLVVAVGLGTALAWNIYAPYLPIGHIDLLRAHAHLAGLGFFGLLIMGVAYRLLEMFLLSHGAPERAGWVAFAATNAAIAALVASFLFPGSAALGQLGLGLAALGIGAFFVQVRAIHKRRMQRRADVAWLHTFTSFFYLAAALAAGTALAVLHLDGARWDQVTLVYGLLALPGFVGTVVVGQMYKIVPFLVWLHRFSPYVGLKKVPGAAELLPERPKRIQYALMHGGLALLATGIFAASPGLRTAGAASFAASAVVVAVNLGRIYTRRPA